MIKLLVRADDLEYSEAVNYGIVKTVIEGIVRSVGVMVNMPATQHGVNLLKQESIAFGLHTNICSGYPISDSEKITSLVAENGEFKTSKHYREAYKNGIDFVDYDEVRLEIEAQYHSFIDLFGTKPDYFEAHAIQSKNFEKAMYDVSQKYDLKYSPIAFNPNKPIKINHKKIYFWFEAMSKNYQPLKTLEKIAKNPHQGGIDLLVLHPGYLDEYLINYSSLTLPRIKEVTMATSFEAKEIINQYQIQLISYKDI